MQTVNITRFNKLYQAAKHLNKAVDDGLVAQLGKEAGQSTTKP